MTEIPVTPMQPQSNNRTRNMILIGVGVVMLLCCCCLIIAVPALWYCGDVLSGVSNSCAPFP